jgi:predicted phosphodiesterase
VKVRLASDLHFEFHDDGGAAIARELAAGDFDLLVVAGDLSSYEGLVAALHTVAASVAPKPVVYVLGNHEGYGASWEAALERARAAQASSKNLTVLERETATIGGRRFVGCTLWFPHSGGHEPLDELMTDFQLIAGMRAWLPETARASAAFLAQTVQPGDIVVTHHLPHPRSISPRFARSKLNPYFLHDVSSTVEQGGAALWIHGHTHTSADYVAGTTRVVCNARGYPGFFPGEPNPQYRADCDVVV